MIDEIKLLDHGYVRFVGNWGSDQSIIEGARMSTGKGFLGWGPKPCPHCRKYDPGFADGFLAGKTCTTCEGTGTVPGDEKLLRFLWEKKHSTPFELAGMTIEVQAPMFVFREWHRHRTQCLAGDTMLHFESPKSKGSRRSVYKMPISEVWRKWQPTVRTARPERQTNALWPRNRIRGMVLRCVNEETKEVVHTHIVDVIKGVEKQLYRVRTLGGKTIRASADHKFFTNMGWLRLEDAVNRGASLSVTKTAREMASAWEVPEIDETTEIWKDVIGWEGLYEVSDAGRFRRCGKQPKRGYIGLHGYPVVSLNRPGVQDLRTVHSLVLEAFKGPRPSGFEARHLNHNRVDVRAVNLEWGSSKENAADRVNADRQQRLCVGFEEIVSYEKDGVEVTYDIEVADPWHNFVADDFVVHNSYSEMSARYAPMPDVNYIPSVERLMMGADKANKQAGTVKGAAEMTTKTAESFRSMLEEEYVKAEGLYQWALHNGVPKELARVHIPVGRYSRMRASANLRNWLGFLTLRMAPDAQWEIREYANAVGNLVAAHFPRTWELFEEGMKSG